MRIIFFLLISFLLAETVLSQPPTKAQPPSKAQMLEQMQEAKKKALQQIANREKEIATAKANNENPETIQEMEKQLATMKKMLGVMDKVASLDDKKPKVLDGPSVAIPPYQSPFIWITKQKVIAPTEAQAKDRLLWYRGKKLNDSTLITTKARVVRYSKKRNIVIIQPDEKKDSSFFRIVKNLSRSRQWTNTYVNNKSAEKNSFFDYPLVMMAMKEYELIEKEFDKIANNTIQLPGTGTNPWAEVFYEPSGSISGPSADYQFNSTNPTDPYIEQLYEEIMSRVNNAPPVDCTPPPKQDFSLCFYCGDPAAQEHYYREKEIWGNALHEFETGIISRILTIERHCQLLGFDAETKLGPSMYANLDRAGKFASDRMEQRIKLLRQRYENDIYRYSAVVSAVLGLERQKQLLGSSTDEFSIEFEIFENRIFENFMEQRIAANDYDVIFNYAMMLGFARQKALLGVADDYYLQDVTDAVVKLNRFAFTINIDFEFQIKDADGKPVLIADGNLSTTQKVYVKLGRNKDCKWQFYLYDPDYLMGMAGQQEEDFKIPITVNSGTKKVKKKEDEWVTYAYSGPTEMLMVFPSFRISFCNGARRDSAMMDILRYKTEDLSGYDMADHYTIDLIEYVNKMFVSVSKTKANVNEFVDITGDMMNISSQATVDNPTGYAKLDKMQVEYKMNGIQHDLQKRATETTKVGNTVILFDAQNGSQLLINNTTNTANSEYNIDLKKGLIKLKVVLEPL